MEEILEKALVIIKAITITGERRIRDRLEAVTDQQRRDIIALMARADRLAWFWQSSWKELGRAYLLAQISNWISPSSGYYPPKDPQADQCMTRWLAQLQISSEQVVRQALIDAVSTRAILQVIVTAQKHVSRSLWAPAHFTDPLHHDPRKFQYLVHAMRPTTGLHRPADDTAAMYAHYDATLGKFIDKQEDNGWILRSAELYLDNPALIHTELLSCSVISDSVKNLYKNFSFGFILSVPSDNVCAASLSDMAISNSRARACVLTLQRTPLHRIMVVQEFLEDLRALYEDQLAPPSAILAGCTGGHNEVIVLGSTGHSVVQVAGIFVKVTSARKLWKSFAAEDAAYGLRALMLACSKKKTIPIIAIEDDLDKEGSGISFDDWLGGKVSTSPKPTIALPPVVKPTPGSPPRSSQPGTTLVIGNHVSTFSAPGLQREYMMPQISQQAQQLLALGRSASQVHRQMHDVDGLPHAVIEHTLNRLGHHNYM